MLDFYPYLNDIDFLKKVAKSHIQTYYVKISVLNWKEQFVQAIEGRVISGSINIDGNSAIRRTLSLNVYIDNLINKITNVENLLSINKKFRAEIGVKNIFTQYSQYDTIWFPQGIFVISSCSVSNSDSGVTASIQAKDKMCLLNGECGGTFPATVVLDTYDTLDQNGQYITLRPTIYHIIQQLVNHFGGQQLNKIIISDLSPLVKKAVRWNDETHISLKMCRAHGLVGGGSVTCGSKHAARRQCGPLAVSRCGHSRPGEPAASDQPVGSHQRPRCRCDDTEEQ